MTLPEEYQQWLNQRLNWFESLRRKLSPGDEPLDFMNMMLLDIAKSLKEPTAAPISVNGDIQNLVGELAETNNNLATLIRTLGGQAQATSEIEQISFRQEVQALQGLILSEHIPSDGHIFEVIIHWPSGCNALVDVKISHGTIPFCPSVPLDSFLALDDVTQSFRFWERVRIEEKLFCEIQNGDSLNPHTISVIAHMQRSG